MVVRLLVVEPHPELRRALRAYLESYARFTVVAAVDSAASALGQAVDLAPDVVIMDAVTCGPTGFEIARQIAGEAPRCAVIIFSMHGEHQLVAAAEAAGALGYVDKPNAVRDLADAIEAASEGLSFLSMARI